jgi:hypothetical protein
MTRTTQYKIVKSHEQRSFTDQCEMLTALGWSPVGGLALTFDASNTNHFAQLFSKETEHE